MKTEPDSVDAVETTNLSKSYGDLVAVRNLNLKIPVGVAYGLIGPNGAGKTTLVKMLCDLVKPTTGEARIFGKKVDKSVASAIGYMPQDVALYVDLSVEDNIRLYGTLAGLDKTELRVQTDRLLDLVGLSDRRSTTLSELSGGMKRKVSLVCALIHKPRLLILDEPTVGVDPTLRVVLWTYFEEIKRSGTTILITTHYMDEATRCDVVGLMQAGTLMIEGKPDQILSSSNTHSLEEAFVKLSSEEVA